MTAVHSDAVVVVSVAGGGGVVLSVLAFGFELSA